MEVGFVFGEEGRCRRNGWQNRKGDNGWGEAILKKVVFEERNCNGKMELLCLCVFFLVSAFFGFNDFFLYYGFVKERERERGLFGN